VRLGTDIDRDQNGLRGRESWSSFRGGVDAYGVDLGDDELDLRLLARRDREECSRVDNREELDADLDVSDDLEPKRRDLGGDVDARVQDSVDVCRAEIRWSSRKAN
jgi:hypothetical protein